MNKVILVGRLTRDPEVRYSQGENTMAIARYTIAVNRRFKREGDPEADFIRCVVFGRAAEFAEKYFRQGLRIVNQPPDPDRKLYEQRGGKGLYDRSCSGRTGICRKHGRT